MTLEEIRVATLEAIRARAAEILSAQEALDETDDWTEEQRTEWDAMASETEQLEVRVADLTARAEVRALATNLANTEPAQAPTIIRKPADPFDLGAMRMDISIGELRSQGRAAVESVEYLDDAGKQEAIRKIDKVRDPRGVVPGLILRTGKSEYVDAFGKYLTGAENLMTDAERDAVRSVNEYRAAMSLTDANGGYAIPFPVDPSIVLTNDGSANPVRQLARVETITTDTWQGISSAGVTASFDAEAAEVSDDSPTFAQPQVTTRMARAFVRGSIEVSQDFPNLAGELTAAFADGRDNLESVKFWSGASGSNEPIGIEVALNGGTSEVDQAAGEAMTVADLYATLAGLAPRYRKPGGRTAWTAELSTINAMRQFATANNYHAFLTDLGGGAPQNLLGYPLHEWSSMDANSDVDASATAVNHTLLVGDWKNYLIADRIGGTVEFVPHLFAAANNLPSFQRGWVYYWRVGADSINDSGFSLYTLTTAA